MTCCRADSWCGAAPRPHDSAGWRHCRMLPLAPAVVPEQRPRRHCSHTLAGRLEDTLKEKAEFESPGVQVAETSPLAGQPSDISLRVWD